MKTKNFAIFALTAFLILALAAFSSASVSLARTDSALATYGNPSTITINFATTSTDNQTLTWNYTSSVSGATISLGNAPTSITTSDGTKTFTAAVGIPQYLKSATFTVNTMNSSGVILGTNSFTVSVNDAKSFSLSSANDIYSGRNSTVITVRNTGNTNLNNIRLTAPVLSGVSFTISPTSISLIPGNSAQFIITASNLASLTAYGSQTATFSATSDESATGSISIALTKSYCTNGEAGSNVTISSIDDRSSGDEWEWAPLKDISIDIDVRNNNQVDSEKITVKLGVYDLTSHKFIELNDGADKEISQSIRINEDDEDTFKFKFKLPADIKDDGGRYGLIVKAYVNGKESSNCASRIDSSSYQPITVDFGDKAVLIGNVIIPDFSSCGSTATITGTMYNLDAGDNEKIQVKFYNKELGLDKTYDSLSELDSGDSEDFSISFDVPQGIKEGTYYITAYGNYDYSESSTFYRESVSQDNILFKVEGNCVVTPKVTINAALASEAQAGKPLSVKVTITNTDSKSQTLQMLADGYSSWATLTNISESQFTLASGASKDIYYNFVVNSDASGDNQFTIKSVSGSTSIKEQAVSVTIAPAKGGFNFNFGNLGLGNNWYIWAIVALNVVLIIVIIVVAIKLLK